MANLLSDVRAQTVFYPAPLYNLTLALSVILVTFHGALSKGDLYISFYFVRDRVDRGSK